MQPRVDKKPSIVGGYATSNFGIMTLTNLKGMSHMNTADRIQNLRKAKGISQEQLADALGVSRQAVSKWESEQSTPDIEKIILMSDYFEVTTDYLLKGIEPITDEREKKPDSRIFTAVGTALNFIGLIAAIMVWIKEQTPIAVAAGLILMAAGCMIFCVGQIIGTGDSRTSAKKSFIVINAWILLFIPISCIFNILDGMLGGFSWRIAPLPLMGNSFKTLGICYLVYFIICITIDFITIKTYKK